MSNRIIIAGKEYELILTTKATKEISKRYGGLSKLGDKLQNTENFELALDEIIWLVTVLANQSVLIHNLTATEKEPLLTCEAVELLTSPHDIAGFKEAITEALYLGTKREVLSEDNPKNA